MHRSTTFELHPLLLSSLWSQGCFEKEMQIGAEEQQQQRVKKKNSERHKKLDTDS